jgi:hypothetical protein
MNHPNEAREREALKPCPFCGGVPDLEDSRTIWVVRCKCGACVLGERAPEPDGHESGAYWDRIRQTAIEAWNRRASLEATSSAPRGESTVYVCPEKDIVCGNRPKNWCDSCPQWADHFLFAPATAEPAQPDPLQLMADDERALGLDYDNAQTMSNGLTEAETAATASVAGCSPFPQPWPARTLEDEIAQTSSMLNSWSAKVNVAQAQRLTEPAERHFALRDGHAIKAEDDYFAARPNEDSKSDRRAFHAGFLRGFDEGRAIEAEARAPISDERIREVFMAHGFTIKPGCDDLKPYVYAAARALLAEAVKE